MNIENIIDILFHHQLLADEPFWFPYPLDNVNILFKNILIFGGVEDEFNDDIKELKTIEEFIDFFETKDISKYKRFCQLIYWLKMYNKLKNEI